MEWRCYQALGNRYLIAPPDAIFAKKNIIIDACSACHSDGLLIGSRLQLASADLRIWNPDGSEAEMSGNGVRIFAKFLLDNNFWKMSGGKIATIGGIASCGFLANGDVTARMAPPLVAADKLILLTQFGPIAGYVVFWGNPHLAIPVDEFPQNWRRVAAILSRHPHFPKKINVHFLRILHKRSIALRIFERGVGETSSCGSGAAACAAVANRHLGCDATLRVNMVGGTLHVTIAKNFLQLAGPVVQVSIGSNHLPLAPAAAGRCRSAAKFSEGGIALLGRRITRKNTAS
jgi:diaminopimelate epimerase